MNMKVTGSWWNWKGKTNSTF